MDSILDSVKKMLGISSDYTQFDNDIMMHINSVFMILNQLGVGPDDVYSISSNMQTWSDFFADADVQVNAVKSYMYMKVRMLFDPPTSSALIESMNKLISEFEWRMMIEGDTDGGVSSGSNGGLCGSSVCLCGPRFNS